LMGLGWNIPSFIVPIPIEDWNPTKSIFAPI